MVAFCGARTDPMAEGNRGGKNLVRHPLTRLSGSSNQRGKRMSIARPFRPNLSNGAAMPSFGQR